MKRLFITEARDIFHYEEPDKSIEISKTIKATSVLEKLENVLTSCVFKTPSFNEEYKSLQKVFNISGIWKNDT